MTSLLSSDIHILMTWDSSDIVKWRWWGRKGLSTLWCQETASMLERKWFFFLLWCHTCHVSIPCLCMTISRGVSTMFYNKDFCTMRYKRQKRLCGGKCGWAATVTPEIQSTIVYKHCSDEREIQSNVVYKHFCCWAALVSPATFLVCCPLTRSIRYFIFVYEIYFLNFSRW